MNLFDIAKLKEDLSKLEQQTLQDGFWNDTKKSSMVLQKSKTLKSKIEIYNKIITEIENLIEMSDLVSNELEADGNAENASLINDIIANTNTIQKDIDDLEIHTLLSGKYDINNAIVTIHPGAGGTESQDWAEMLYRMYTRWSNSERIFRTGNRLSRR